jgi:hypothetical protein
VNPSPRPLSPMWGEMESQPADTSYPAAAPLVCVPVRMADVAVRPPRPVVFLMIAALML